MGLPSFSKMDAESQKKMKEELTRMTNDLTESTTAMDGINLAEAKEKEAEAWKTQMADRTKKEKERRGEFDKAMDEEKQVMERM